MASGARKRHEQERDARRDARTRRGAGRLDEGVGEFVVIVDACRACRAPFVDGFFVVDACRDVVLVCFEPGGEERDGECDVSTAWCVDDTFFDE